MYSKYEPLIGNMIYQDFFHSAGFIFTPLLCLMLYRFLKLLIFFQFSIFIFYLYFWCHIKYFIAKSNVKKWFPYICFQEFLSFSSYIQVFDLVIVNFCICHKVRISFHFFCMWMSNFPNTTDWKDSLSPHWMVLTLSLKIIWPYMWRVISGLTTLFDGWLSLFLRQYHTIFVIAAL